MVKMDLKWLVLGMWILPDSGSEESSIYDRASFSKSVCSVNECLIHLPLSYVMSIHIFHMDHKFPLCLRCSVHNIVVFVVHTVGVLNMFIAWTFSSTDVAVVSPRLDPMTEWPNYATQALILRQQARTKCSYIALVQPHWFRSRNQREQHWPAVVKSIKHLST